MRTLAFDPPEPRLFPLVETPDVAAKLLGVMFPTGEMEIGLPDDFEAEVLRRNAGYAGGSKPRFDEIAVRTIVDVVQTAGVFQVDASDAAELMRPQRQDMTYLDSADELGTYFVVPQGLEMPEHLTPTMVAAMCANGWLWAHNDRMTDVTAFENPDVFANSLKLIAKTGWNGKHATVKMDDGSLRTAVPLTQAREGATMYCAVGQVATEFGKATFCDGFFDADSLKEAVEFVKNGWEMRYPCGVSMVVDPLKGGDDAYFNVSRALVPPSTPLDGMQDRLTELAATEEPLPAPELAK